MIFFSSLLGASIRVYVAIRSALKYSLGYVPMADTPVKESSSYLCDWMSHLPPTLHAEPLSNIAIPGNIFICFILKDGKSATTRLILASYKRPRNLFSLLNNGLRVHYN